MTTVKDCLKLPGSKIYLIYEWLFKSCSFRKYGSKLVIYRAVKFWDSPALYDAQKGFSTSWSYNWNTSTCYTRNSSEDEIANVNFLYDDIVRALQNTVDSCINSAAHRSTRLCVGTRFTEFSGITQCNGHYAVQGHSRSPIWVPIESSYTTYY